MSGPAALPRPREAYLDWARGLAVLIMIEAHTLDAWTRAIDRRGSWFRDLTVLGGFAAPLFLWLAGVAIVLAAARAAERQGSRAAGVETGCRRGLEIFVLAFLFRAQALIITPGGDAITLFRVDVLNVMGPSMVAVALLWGVGRTVAGQVAACGALAAAVAMATPIVRTTDLVTALPLWIQWYIRPAGDLTTFTLFPWSGFVLAGGAVGSLVVAARGERTKRTLQMSLAASGVALVAAGFYAARLPSIYRSASFWTSSPTWFAIRAGVLLLAVAALFAASLWRHGDTPSRDTGLFFRVFVLSWQAPLARIGRSSLFVYWIHVELVYGYASWLWRHRLPLWATVVAYAAFCVLMYGAVVLRDRLAGIWRARQTGPSSGQARPAEAAGV
jgi:uncharacterized membrane protein